MLTRLFKLIVLIIPLLFACATPKPPPSLNGKPITGLIVKDDLIIPSTAATIRFQQGTQASSVDRFTPFCEFEVNDVSEEPQIVAPGRFRVGRVDYRVVADSVTRIHLIMARDRGCDDPIYPETRFLLQSQVQPQVRSLTCLNVCIHCRTGCYYLGPKEIQAILGPSFAWEVTDERQ